MGREIDYRALLSALPDLVFVVDPNVRLRYVNDAGRAILGLEPEAWIGRNVLDLVHPDDVAVVLSSTSALQGKRIGTPIELRVRTGTGEWKWLEVIGADALGDNGIDGLICAARDLTQRRMWEVASGDTARFQQVVQHAPAITLLLDAGGRIESVNGAFTRLLGHDPTHVIGRPLISFAAAEGVAELAAAVDRCITTGASLSCEATMRVATPQMLPRPIRFELVNLLDDPVVGGVVVSAHDVSELHLARESLEHLARHDALTGLVNRFVLLERLDEIVKRRQPAAVIFIDLDRFKPVNDLLGHEAGDDLLRQVAARLQAEVRPNDIVARVGGDEFVAVAMGVTDRTIGVALCERIDAALASPYMLSAGPVRLTASVGMSIANADSTVTGLLADADLTMYDTKAGRRGDPVRSLPERQRTATQRRRLADDLATGLRRGKVVAHFQPIIDVESRRTTGVEALARWNHPDLGLLEPASFLDLAADANLDLLLGDVILEAACAMAGGAGHDLQLCVNLSVAQLTDRDLCDRVGLILARHRLPPSRLRVEITEHATLSRRGGGGGGRVAPEKNLLALCEMGASLSLDDFGTGYSSLTHVRRFPLSAIKIDRSFVTGAASHREDQAVVAAVVGLARSLNLQVVGEGVETVEQLDTLRALGCDAVQGFLTCPPLDRDAFAAWMRRAGDDWTLATPPSARLSR